MTLYYIIFIYSYLLYYCIFLLLFYFLKNFWCFVEESQKTFIKMENVLIPLDYHYGSIITQCNTLERAYMYKKALLSCRFALLDLLNMFRYNQNENFFNPRFYRSIQRQLLDVEMYIKEVDEVIEKLKLNL